MLSDPRPGPVEGSSINPQRFGQLSTPPGDRGHVSAVTRRCRRGRSARPVGARGTHAPIYGGRGPRAPHGGPGRPGLVAHKPRSTGLVAHKPRSTGLVAHKPRSTGVVAHNPQTATRDPSGERQPSFTAQISPVPVAARTWRRAQRPRWLPVVWVYPSAIGRGLKSENICRSRRLTIEATMQL